MKNYYNKSFVVLGREDRDIHCWYSMLEMSHRLPKEELEKRKNEKI